MLKCGGSFGAFGPIRVHVQRRRLYVEEFRWSVGKVKGATFYQFPPFLILFSDVCSILEGIDGGDTHRVGFGFLLHNLR